MSGNPNWKKGVTGNPLGRPRVPEIEILRKAVEQVGKEQGKTLWRHMVERAYKNDVMAAVLAKKFVPDLTHGEITGVLGINFDDVEIEKLKHKLLNVNRPEKKLP